MGSLLQVARSKKHIRDLLFFLRIVKSIFDSQIVSITGFKFQIKGKLGGKLRKSKFKYKIGKLPLSQLSLFIVYSSIPVYTRFGVFGLNC